MCCFGHRYYEGCNPKTLNRITQQAETGSSAQVGAGQWERRSHCAGAQQMRYKILLLLFFISAHAGG
jgi:hypothetical protein